VRELFQVGGVLVEANVDEFEITIGASRDDDDEVVVEKQANRLTTAAAGALQCIERAMNMMNSPSRH